MTTARSPLPPRVAQALVNTIYQETVAGDETPLDAPTGGTGAEIFAEAPSSPTTAPVTGFAAGLLHIHFRAGGAPGD